MTSRRNIARARELRRDMTPPERALWKLLRAHRMEGWDWRRQHPIGNYYADFACPAAMFVVELDGRSHDDRQDADDNRDAVLKELGWTTLRIPNRDLMRDAEGVWQTIVGKLDGLQSELGGVAAVAVVEVVEKTKTGEALRAGEEIGSWHARDINKARDI